MIRIPCKDCGVRDPELFSSDLSSRCKECEEFWATGEVDEDETDEWTEEE